MYRYILWWRDEDWDAVKQIKNVYLTLNNKIFGKIFKLLRNKCTVSLAETFPRLVHKLFPIMKRLSFFFLWELTVNAKPKVSSRHFQWRKCFINFKWNSSGFTLRDKFFIYYQLHNYILIDDSLDKIFLHWNFGSYYCHSHCHSNNKPPLNCVAAIIATKMCHEHKHN